MAVARRLYVYIIAAISLAVLGVGLANLLNLAFSEIGAVFRSREIVEGDPDYLRRQLSLYTALVVVALPIWLFHWRAADRGARGASQAALIERGSGIRSLYLAFGLLVPFVFWLLAAIELLGWLLAEALGAPRAEFDQPDISGALARLLIAGAIWSYHVWLRVNDERGAPLDPTTDWPPRLYRYVATFVGAMLLLFGGSDLIRLILDGLFGVDDLVGSPARWWADPLASGTARAIAGLVVWAAHAGYGLRLLDLGDWRGERERASAIRRLYLYLVVLVCVFFTLRAVSESLEALLALLLGARAEPSGHSVARRLLGPPLQALPFALFWFEHRRRVLGEGARFAEGLLQATVRRLYTYAVAAVGLAFAGVGTAVVLNALIDQLLGESRAVSAGEEGWRRTVAQFGALAMVGAAAWLRHWYQAQRRVQADPEDERGATIRRAYLFLVVGAALVTLLVTLAIILYRILSIILGVERAGDFFNDMSPAPSAALIASGLLGYHVSVLRADLAARVGREPSHHDVPLLLTVPAGADPDAILADLSSHLPEGVSLRRRSR